MDFKHLRTETAVETAPAKAPNLPTQVVGANLSVRPSLRQTYMSALNSLLSLVFAGLIFLLVSCEREQPPPPPAPPKVTVSQPVVREIIEWDEYTGRLQAVESVEVRARVSGYLESVHFDDGQVVKEGDLLFVIDPRQYQAELDRAEAELELAKSRLSLAESDLTRARRLLSSRAISEEEADTRAANVRQAEAQLQSVRAAVDAAKLDVDFTRVNAPITGRVSREFVTEGNLINGGTGGTLLTTIVSLDPIHCYFEVNESAFLKYVRLSRTGERPSSREVQNPVYLALSDEQEFRREGHMDFVDNQLDPDTGTMTGRAVFPNPDLVLTAGLFARVRLQGSSKYEAVMIPDEAIGSDQAQRFALIVNDKNVVEYREVRMGPVINGLRVISEGLKPDDWVVVNGIQRVRPGAKVSPQKQKITPKSENFLTPDLSPAQAESGAGG